MVKLGNTQNNTSRLECEICGYKAKRTTHLTLHKESKHEGVTYGCDICNFKTIQKGFLTVHKQVEHEGKRFECTVCNFKAKHRQKIRVDYQRKHTDAGNYEGVVDVIDLDSGTVLLQHEMPMISFASGGDSDSLDYIAYVAKDSMGGRYLINKND